MEEKWDRFPKGENKAQRQNNKSSSGNCIQIGLRNGGNM